MVKLQYANTLHEIKSCFSNLKSNMKNSFYSHLSGKCLANTSLKCRYKNNHQDYFQSWKCKFGIFDFQVYLCCLYWYSRFYKTYKCIIQYRLLHSSHRNACELIRNTSPVLRVHMYSLMRHSGPANPGAHSHLYQFTSSMHRPPLWLQQNNSFKSYRYWCTWSWSFI